MTRRRTLFLALAIILGLSTILMMRQAMHHPKEASIGTEILVAATDIPSGQFLQAQNLRWQPWAPDHVTEAFILHTADNGEEMIGAVARQGIRAGEPILRGTVVKPKDRGFLAAVLEPGMRAVAAPITSVTGIAGFVFPGDRVDLILTHTVQPNADSGNQQHRASVTLVKNVRVLALDQNANDQNTNQPKVAQVVTLEVSPKQAEVVTLALQLGTLSLSLRSIAQDDNGTPLAEPVGFENGKYTLDSDVSHLIPAPKDHVDITSEVVRVLRGKEKTEASFVDKTSADGKDMIDGPRQVPQ